MKKTVFAALLASLLLLSACGEKTPTDATPTTTDNNAVTTVTADAPGSETAAVRGETTLRPLAEKALEAAAFDEAPNIVFSSDEYAEDLLMFSYGVEEHTDCITDFFLSEAPSKSANTIAYFKLKDGVTPDETAYIRTAINDGYIANLKASVEAYNPDAYKLCTSAVIKEYPDAILLVIAPDAQTVISAVESAR